MKLTGKCKEDFEKWLYNNEGTYKFDAVDVFNVGVIYGYPFSMQYGVYVDFFDSVGIGVETYRVSESNYEPIVIDFNQTGEDISYGLTNSRHEARTKAIEKANGIYNEKQVVH